MDNKQELIKKMIQDYHRNPPMALITLLLAGIVTVMGILTCWLFKTLISVIDKFF